MNALAVARRAAPLALAAPLAASLALAGCIESPAADSQVLPEDVHYIVYPAGFTTPEECIATVEQPFSCIESMSLCKNGRAGLRRGDILEDGTYELDGSIATLELESWDTMKFNVDTVSEPDSPSVSWRVDTARRWETLQFDNIGCDQL